jgi:hypothetical protein
MANNGLTRRLSAVSLVLGLLCMLSFAAPSLAKLAPTVPRPANPFLDPKRDPYNPLKYIASNVLTAVAFSEFYQHTFSPCPCPTQFPGLVIIVALIQSYFTFKWGTKFMLSMVIGEYSESYPLPT